MKIIYLPLDERPCNTLMVERIADTADHMTLVLPPDEMLGKKKQGADTERLWEWIRSVADDCDALILSMDMLVYGGLLPSRLHEFDKDRATVVMDRLRQLRSEQPERPIYAFSLIMRTPRYSSSDEEPDYYGDWGREIFLRAYLNDKQTIEGLTDDELKHLENIEHQVPAEYVADYEARRLFNLAVNLEILELVQDGVLDLLVIPQDDSAEFGYTAMDQREVYQHRRQLELEEQVLIYPGADEAGATLLARVYNDLSGRRRPKIYPIWSSELGPELIPMYEDRPFRDTLNLHVQAAGCQLTERPETADLILAYNTPGQVMQESWEQSARHHTYTTKRHMPLFVKHIADWIQQGKKVIVADSAYANGGDFELIRLLDDHQLLDALVSYKGWNTNANTLGSTIAQGVIGFNGNAETIKENVIYHILDDYVYQAEIRMEMTEDYLPVYDLDYFDLKDQADKVCQERDKRMLKRYSQTIMSGFQDVEIEQFESWAPWNRMFECGLNVRINDREGKGY